MRNRSQLALGIVLILLGGHFIAQLQFPQWRELTSLYMVYPLNIVAIGALIFLVGLVVGATSMSIPAAIVAGIGGILYYQKMSGDYSSWMFLWTLIPGFAGIGEMLSGLLSRNSFKLRAGANSLLASGFLSLIFASIFGRMTILGPYGLPAILIVIGVWIVVRGLWKRK